MRRITMMAALCVLAGCADVRMPNAVEHAQFAWLQKAAINQAREKPPTSEAEAERLVEMQRVAADGVRLTAVELKHKGRPDRPVPKVTDHDAVRAETDRYEEDVQAEIIWRGFIDDMKARWGFGAPGALAGATGLMGTAIALLVRKLRQRGRELADGKKGGARAKRG